MINKNWKPHESHVMTEWESTIVTLVATSRFGSLRRCKNCGAEEAKTVAGHAAHDELSMPCVEVPEDIAAQACTCGCSACEGTGHYRVGRSYKKCCPVCPVHRDG